jgi:hypothetical protein
MKSEKPIRKKRQLSSAGGSQAHRKGKLAAHRADVRSSQQGDLLIAAIGASTELLKHLPGDTGMAFIFIQHLGTKAC